jgi:hypothetical protein
MKLVTSLVLASVVAVAVSMLTRLLPSPPPPKVVTVRITHKFRIPTAAADN